MRNGGEEPRGVPVIPVGIAGLLVGLDVAGLNGLLEGGACVASLSNATESHDIAVRWMGVEGVSIGLERNRSLPTSCPSTAAQLALFSAGKEALLADDDVVPALEAVVERGVSDEAKEFARNALISVRGFADPSELN